MNYLKGFLASLGMFSVIPVPHLEWNDKVVANMIPTFPIVGLILGSLWYGFGSLLLYLGLPINITVVAMTLFMPIMTGFIHLDGYMDTADAILSRRPELSDRRRILKDSTTGAFAVIAVICYFLTLYAVMGTIIEGGITLKVLVPAAVIARSLGGSLVIALPSMSSSGYGAGFRKDAKATSFIIPIIATVLSLSYIFIIMGINGLFSAFMAITIGLIIARCCYKNLQGFSGDLAGCTITFTEVMMLLLVAVMVG